MADKPKPLPWEDKPWVDPRVATQRALAAAQRPRTDLKSAGVTRYAKTAFDAEIGLVRNPPGGYNDQLFKSGANLYELVAAGALDETTVENALRDAMRDNGYERDKGENAVTGTIKSARRRGLDNPRDLSRVGTRHTNGATIENAPVKTVEFSSIFTLEQGFWTARDSLKNIYLGSLSLMCSPWAVLGYCAARALALVRPNCLLPPTIVGPGSLNWFCAIAARSGGGKSGADDVAQQLVKDFVLQLNLGSGEGLIDAYVKPADKENGEPQGLHESVMFIADESDNMRALANRTGSTLGSTLRSAFTGKKLGFSNRTASSLHLQAQSYRMTLVCNVQPERAGALMDDQYGGTLQRFMWFPAKDARCTPEIPPMPAALVLPSPAVWQYPRELKIPYEATELIRDERARDMRDETDVLDGHALFIREKFAYALAVLDGRDEMTSEDWRLAGIASRVSDRTREWVTEQMKESADQEATKHGRTRGVEQFAAREEEAEQSGRITKRLTDWAITKVVNAGRGGIKNRDLINAANSPDRRRLKIVLETMRCDDLVRFDDKQKRWYQQT
jgi:hypothetical protein